MPMRQFFLRLKAWFQGLSFRTGVIVLLLCVPCYLISFAVFALPSEVLSVGGKSAAWFVLFGLAKTFQYGGLTILGVEGWRRLKARFGKRRKFERSDADAVE